MKAKILYSFLGTVNGLTQWYPAGGEIETDLETVNALTESGHVVPILPEPKQQKDQPDGKPKQTKNGTGSNTRKRRGRKSISAD